MNHIYRLVWSDVQNAFVACAEFSRARGKRSGLTVLAAAMLSAPALAADLPTGGQIVAGSGQISQNGSTLTVTQDTQRMAADWQNFSIGRNHTVNFEQPSASSVALNRVLGSEVSVIQGALNANGQVFLVNPNGVLFSPTAQVDVGALVASTLDIATDDFMAGRYRFAGDSDQAVVNQGRIQAKSGGTVALIAGRIVNTGSIEAPRGNVLMGAGRKVTLDLGGPVKIQIDEGALQAQIDQGGAIIADGGTVYLTAQAAGDLASAAINHSGIIEARTLATGERGEIILLGDLERGTVQVSGRLDASAPVGGDGGFIETSAATVRIADSAAITTRAPGGATGTWLIDPQDFTIAASGGDITGTALGEQLADNNVIIESVNGAIEGNGDIFVQDDVTWSSGNTLTLHAERNIHIRAAIDASQEDGGRLVLEYGQASLAAGNGARYDFGLTASGFTGSIGLQAGQNFSTRLGSDGAVVDYTVITDRASLANLNNDLSGNYALGNDINAAGTPAWVPIGSAANHFDGTLDGLGHAITNINVNRNGQDHVGLFSYVGSDGEVRNVGMEGGTVRGRWQVGGIAGRNDGVITQSYANTQILGDFSGGLVGWNEGSISQSYANGALTGQQWLGGLVGINGTGGGIDESYATGQIIGADDIGGLVGENRGAIGRSYATGNVQGIRTGGEIHVGGLVGWNTANGSITQSYATGNVSGFEQIGGLVGWNQGTISQSYALGNVTGTLDLGGLVGDGNGSISDSFYATTDGSNALNDTINNGGDTSAGYTGNSRGAARTLAELRELDTFAAWNADIDDQGGTGTVWRIYDGNTTPLLRAFLNAFDVSVIADSKTYDGLAYTGAGYDPSGGGLAQFFLSGDAMGAVDAGTYAMAIYSAQQGYDLIGDLTGTLTIDPRVLDLTGSRVYDRSTDVATAVLTIAGLVSGESLTLTGSGATASDRNAGQGKALTSLGTIALADGDTGSASNYTLAGGTHTVDITPRALTASGIIASDKIYDGTTDADIDADSVVGILGEDSVAANGRFVDKNVGTAKTVELFLTGADAGNYSIDSQDSVTADITPKAVTVAGISASDKVYDGTTDADLTYTDANFTGLIVDDIVTASGAFADRHADIGKTVTLSFGGDDAGNYTFTGQETSTANITPRALAASYAAADKVYDSTVAATISATSTDLIEGDAVTVTADGAFADRNVGTDKVVTVSGGALTGDDAGNYTLSNTAGATTADITPRAITGTITATDKVYDGTTAAITSGTLAGVIDGDTLSFDTSGSFTDKNAGIDKTVNVDGTLGGADAGNYTVVNNDTTTAAITPKAATVGGITASDKVYDGTTDADLTYTDANFTGLIVDDIVTASGVFADRHADTGKTVTLSFGGDDAGNYTFTGQETSTANITPRALTASYAAADKVYDGTVAATISATSTDLIEGDAVTVTADGAFADRNAGTDKAVTVSGGALTGDDAGNYTLSNTAGATTADITPRAITGTITATDKVYDGTTAAITSGTLAGMIDGDTLSFDTSGSFADKNAGIDKTVNVDGTLAGADAGNYTVVSNDTATAAITPKAATVAGISANDKVYDGTTDADLTYTDANFTGLIVDDIVTASGVFADRHADTGKTVTLSFGGDDAGNYTFTGQETSIANIMRRPVAVVADAKTITEGQQDPLLTYTTGCGPVQGACGLVNGETLAGSLTRAPGRAAGSYAIGQGSVTDSENPNYAITYQGAEFSILASAGKDMAVEAAIAKADQEASQGDREMQLGGPLRRNEAAGMRQTIQIVSTGIRIPENMLSDEEKE